MEVRKISQFSATFSAILLEGVYSANLSKMALGAFSHATSSSAPASAAASLSPPKPSSFPHEAKQCIIARYILAGRSGVALRLKRSSTNRREARRDAFERKGPQRWLQKRLDRRWEEVAEAVGGGYCRLQIPLKPVLGVREAAAGHRLGALEGGGGGASPPSNASPEARPPRLRSNFFAVVRPLHYCCWAHWGQAQRFKVHPHGSVSLACGPWGVHRMLR